ncbi:MAG TPA: TonB-dependent receptor [Segetibacter sp.]|nr:TonB-dependent receptor [Segetibacter sp.]
MKSIIITFCFTGIIHLSNAQALQNNNTVKGSVKNVSGTALQAVTVSLLSVKDSSLEKAEVTDDKGKFTISNIKSGKYLLNYTIVGYDKAYSPVFELKDGHIFTALPVRLKPSAATLKEVTVTATKPMIEVRADKTVFNVESSINATGSNALELLQKSPGVMVDNNDNISMKGKTGVKIYVDGKPMQLNSKDLAAYLKGIKSNDIEALEMISNPSAKYDASGNAGIINIRLKKNKKYGTNGSATMGLIQGITPKGDGSLNLNYRDKKINLFSNVSTSRGKYENDMSLFRIQNDTIYDQHTLNHWEDRNINFKAGADLFATPQSTIGIMANGSFSKNEWTSDGYTPITYKPSGLLIKELKSSNRVPAKRQNFNANLNYRFADTSGKEINVDLDYGLFHGTGRSFQPNYYYNPEGSLLYSVINANNTPTDIYIYTAKLDVEFKKWKGKLGYGAKLAYVKTKNSFDFFNVINGGNVKVPERSNGFTYTENVNAAYVNFQRPLSKKWSIQTGVRMEQTNSHGELTRADGVVQADNNVKRNYLDFFPSAALTFTVNDKNSLNLTYSRRIDRPTYQDLNPFENKLDELTYQKGNAFLRPQYTNSFELTHTFISKINTTIGYSHVKDYSTYITDTTNGNATYIQQRNLAKQEILNASVGSPLPIAKWWNGYGNVWFSYQMFRGKFNNHPLRENYPMYGAYMQNTFTLGKDYSAELSGWFNGPGVWAGTWKSKPQGGIDVGLQKLFLQKKATVKVSVTDVFFTNPWRSTTDFGGVYIKGRGQWESRTFRINFTYRFGSNEIKSARERKTGLESEKKRIKS